MQPWSFRNFFQPSQGRRDKKKHRYAYAFTSSRLLPVLIVGAVAFTLLMLVFRGTHHACSDEHLTKTEAEIAAEFGKTASSLVALLHYVTSPKLPQQSISEIRGPFDILQSLAPCNFLVFGIGHDSLMWDSFNPHGTTLFLEEDPKWTRSALQRFPILHAHTVQYHTRLSQADELLSSYKKDCWDGGASLGLKGNRRCRLALGDLPDEVYNRDWDVIMIDGPRGYFAAAPGRMAVIYSAAVMARARRRQGVTHVFLHDVDRKVEKQYAKEFLCMKYKVSGVGRLWHFVIPPAFNFSDTTHGFC